jgi:hypothetical protein
LAVSSIKPCVDVEKTRTKIFISTPRKTNNMADADKPFHVVTGIYTTLAQHCVSQPKPNAMQYLLAVLAKLGKAQGWEGFPETMDIIRHKMEDSFKDMETINDVAAAD